jgi:hypothetical protein
MRITVVGVLIIVGAIVALAIITDKLIARNINKQRRADNDQPNPNS